MDCVGSVVLFHVLNVPSFCQDLTKGFAQTWSKGEEEGEEEDEEEEEEDNVDEKEEEEENNDASSSLDDSTEKPSEETRSPVGLSFVIDLFISFLC